MKREISTKQRRFKTDLRKIWMIGLTLLREDMDMMCVNFIILKTFIHFTFDRTQSQSLSPSPLPTLTDPPSSSLKTPVMGTWSLKCISKGQHSLGVGSMLPSPFIKV